MTEPELYHHYMKRFRFCIQSINALSNNCMNPKWKYYVSLFHYYDTKLKALDMSFGRSTAGGGNYKSKLS